MLKRILFLSLLLALLIPAAQAQRKLNKPKKLKVDGYNISWSAVRNAGSYEVSWRWLDPGIRGGVQTPRISREWHFQNVGNRTDYVLVHLVNNQKYRVRVRALPRENANRQKSDWAVFPTVRLLTPTDPPPPTNTPLPPLPTNTPIPPTNTPIPTATPTPQPLAAPGNFRALDQNTVAWDAATGASRYILAWGASNGQSQTYKLPNTQTTFRLENRDPRVIYRFSLKSEGDGIRYEWASDTVYLIFAPLATATPTATATNTPTNTPVPTDTATPTETPDPLPLTWPRNLRHVSGGTVAWDPVDGAQAYRILLSGPNIYHRSSNTQFTIPDLVTGNTYTVLVQALGDGIQYVAEGSWGTILRFTLTATAAKAPTPTNTPAPPTNTTTTTNTPVPTDTPAPSSRLTGPTVYHVSGATIRWDPVPGAVSYRVQLFGSCSHPNDLHDASGTQFTIPNIPLGDNCLVYVQGRDQYGFGGDWSDELVLADIKPRTDTPVPTATPVTPTETPVPPAELLTLPSPIVHYVSGTTVRWDPVPGAVGYRLYARCVNPNELHETSATQFTIPNIPLGKHCLVFAQGRGDNRTYKLDGNWSSALVLVYHGPPTDTPTPVTPTAVPPTNTPVPIQEWRNWQEDKTEACGEFQNCTYRRSCAVICYRAVAGADCVDDPAEQRCQDWEQISSVYHTTLTPTPVQPTAVPK